MQNNIFQAIYNALICPNPWEKISQTYCLFFAYEAGIYKREKTEVISIADAGRPEKPYIVSPKDVPRRRLGTKEGLQALLHAVCHIEFNAINLALDAAYRFQDMPEQFTKDWLQVAKEECYHFALILERLRQLGADYGDFPAHGGLWEACHETEYDVLVRMALVPRVMEARGLDVTPKIQEKLASIGEIDTIKRLDIILQEERGHVAIGSHWFKYCCNERTINYREKFAELLSGYIKAKIKGPFNIEARLQAGFDDLEIAYLQNISE